LKAVRPGSAPLVRRSLLDLPEVAFVSQGRAAISLALSLEGIGTGASVLIPAFHCDALRAAVRSVGADVDCFEIGEDLQISLESVLRAGRRTTKAVVLPHLFVVRQPPELFRALREQTNWIVIEDCAHSFFSPETGDQIGANGHYAVGSLSKFFPIGWGGVLASSERRIDLRLARAGPYRDLKLFANAIEAAASYGGLGPFSSSVQGLLAQISKIRGYRPTIIPADTRLEGANSRDFKEDVDLALLNRDAGRLAPAMAYRLARDGLRLARRQEVAAAIQDLISSLRPNEAPLRTTQPEFPPYVVPLILPDPKRQFARLRESGVPLYRWENSVRDVCRVADWYSTALVQLPCHESISPQQLEAVTQRILRVLE